MKKFLTLLKKELRELIAPQMVIPLIIMVLVFSFIGTLLKKEIKETASPHDIAVIDEDQSTLSSVIKQTLGNSNFIVKEPQGITINDIFKNEPQISLIVSIPKGFGEGIKMSQFQEIKIYRSVSGFSALSAVKGSVFASVPVLINSVISDQIIKKEVTDLPSSFIKNPVQIQNFTYIKGKTANINPDAIMGFIQTQTSFIPIILFLVIVMAAQMVASTIAAEKENKTLETLLSLPLERNTIILAKIVGSGVVASLFAAAYMLGFRSYINGFTQNPASAAVSDTLAQGLSQLGITLTTEKYILLGISLFASILCALTIAIILGILAEDVQGVQAVITPLIVAVLIPYFLTLLFDINALPNYLKLAVYIIPFSHTFLASHNLLMDNFLPVFAGIAYQGILFIILIIIAAKIFSSDQILTLKLSFKKK